MGANGQAAVVFGSGWVVVLEQPSKMSVFGGGWVVVLAKDWQPLLKMSVLACFSIGWVVVLEQDQPPSKTSVLAHFRQWLGGGAGKGPTAAENEHTCLFRH